MWRSLASGPVLLFWFAETECEPSEPTTERHSRQGRDAVLELSDVLEHKIRSTITLLADHRPSLI